MCGFRNRCAAGSLLIAKLKSRQTPASDGGPAAEGSDDVVEDDEGDGEGVEPVTAFCWAG